MSGRVHIIGEQKGAAPIVDFNQVVAEEDAKRQVAEMEMWLAKRIGEHVSRAYPRRHWEVGCDLEGGMVILKCPSVSLTKGYHIAVARRNLNDICVIAAKAAGEILERHGMTRGRVKDVGIWDALETDLRGDYQTPDSEGINPLKVIHV